MEPRDVERIGGVELCSINASCVHSIKFLKIMGRDGQEQGNGVVLKVATLIKRLMIG